MARQKQLELRLSRRGGKRRGAGRKARGPQSMVSHKSRPRFGKPAPVHVTVRVARHVWNLRSRRCFNAIAACFEVSCGRFGLRLIEFSIMGNHLHLILEADSNEALSRGMQGLNVRIAKALNRLMNVRGRVLADHYHARLLATPTQLVSAIAYVLGNSRHHYGEQAERDPFSSVACERARLLCVPLSWLLRAGWRRARRKPPEIDRALNDGMTGFGAHPMAA